MSVGEFFAWMFVILGGSTGLYGHAIAERPDNSDRRQAIAEALRVAGPIVALVAGIVGSAIRAAQ